MHSEITLKNICYYKNKEVIAEEQILWNKRQSEVDSIEDLKVDLKMSGHKNDMEKDATPDLFIGKG